MYFISFLIERQHFALHLSQIDRVIPAMTITPLSNPSQNIMGIINVHGALIPVINLRENAETVKKEIDLNDKFLICCIENRKWAFWIDSIKGVFEYPQEALIPAKKVFPHLEYIDFFIKEKEHIIFVYNLKNAVPKGF